MTREHAIAAQDRFWSYVNIPFDHDECWEWKRSRMRNGYGVACIGKARIAAHRVAYLIVVGPIPEGRDLDHLCRNRGCVNPKHLEAVSRATNLRRSSLTGPGMNFAKTHCINGHDLTVAYVLIDKKGVLHRLCRKCQAEKRSGVCPICGKGQTMLKRHMRLKHDAR